MWNYRVIRTIEERTGRDSYAIHEVYYDDAGKMQAMTADPVEAMGESLEELIHDLIWQLNACTKPVVEPDDIPEEGAEPLNDAVGVLRATDPLAPVRDGCEHPEGVVT